MHVRKQNCTQLRHHTNYKKNFTGCPAGLGLISRFCFWFCRDVSLYTWENCQLNRPIAISKGVQLTVLTTNICPLTILYTLDYNDENACKKQLYSNQTWGQLLSNVIYNNCIIFALALLQSRILQLLYHHHSFIITIYFEIECKTITYYPTMGECDPLSNHHNSSYTHIEIERCSLP